MEYETEFRSHQAVSEAYMSNLDECGQVDSRVQKETTAYRR